MFDHNQYSSIAIRQNQFTLIGESMNHLVKDCQSLVELAGSKRRKLDTLSDKMKDLVSTLKTETESKLLEISKDLSLNQDSTNALQERVDKENAELAKKQREARTGFYYFLK
jgi:hypothetical protein